MKKQDRRKTNGNSHAACAVRVEFNDPNATEVAIAGTFNNWRPEVTRMIPLGCGRWLKELMLPPGTYEYLFVADGKWLPDPWAEKSVRNPFGGVNSLMTVTNGDATDT
jgi:5'-AMP-activated protein kinase regulatory beta subunit